MVAGGSPATRAGRSLGKGNGRSLLEVVIGPRVSRIPHWHFEWGTAVRMTVTVDLIAAARPNFMKWAPLYKALAAGGLVGAGSTLASHTAATYVRKKMSDAFLKELGPPDPTRTWENTRAGTLPQQRGSHDRPTKKKCLRVIRTGSGGGRCKFHTVALHARRRENSGSGSTATLEAGLRSGADPLPLFPEELNEHARPTHAPPGDLRLLD